MDKRSYVERILASAGDSSETAVSMRRLVREMIASREEFVVYDEPAPHVARRRKGAAQDIHKQLRPEFPVWTFFFPKDLREGMFRDWLDERDMHRARGRSEFFICLTLVTQLLIGGAISMKDFIAETIARTFGGPRGPGAA